MSIYGVTIQRSSNRAWAGAMLAAAFVCVVIQSLPVKADNAAPSGASPTSTAGPAAQDRSAATSKPAASTPTTLPATQPALTPISATASSTAATTRPTRDPLSDLPSYGAALRKAFYVLLAIIGALLLIAKVLPRFLKLPQLNNNRSTKLLGVVESHRLEPRKSLHLVRVGEQFFLVGSTGDRLELLSGGAIDHEKLAAAIKAGESRASTLADGATTTPAVPKRSFGDVLRGKKN